MSACMIVFTVNGNKQIKVFPYGRSLAERKQALRKAVELANNNAGAGVHCIVEDMGAAGVAVLVHDTRIRQSPVIVQMQVKKEPRENGNPVFIGFFESDGILNCFTFDDGHNTASRDYMGGLDYASEEETQKFIAAYQGYIDSLPGGLITFVPGTV